MLSTFSQTINHLQMTLWNTFHKNFFSENKSTSRLFLYTLVALKFHGVSYLPQLNIQHVRVSDTSSIELPDFELGIFNGKLEEATTFAEVKSTSCQRKSRENISRINSA